jgi:hypothetical protein
MIKRTFALTIVSALLFLGPGLAPAQAQTTDKGLYGTSAPTFDGVFRQAIAMIGLNAAGARPSTAAVNWLLRQQCADGSFESYRANTSAPCTPGNAETFTGSNVQQTALAAIALYQNNRISQARRAIVWLNTSQNADFGFPTFRGDISDANSTGLALLALQTVQPQDRSARIPNAKRFLRSLQVRCASGGGLAYQRGMPADVISSSQAYLGLVGGLPVEPNANLRPNPRCSTNTAANVGSYLARPITQTGALANAFGPGPDSTSTSVALLGFVSEGVGREAVRRGLRTLQANARTYALKDGKADPAAAGLLLMVARATDTNPRTFGGVNLVTALQGSER